MLFLAGGMPRSGTTWLFNVAAKLLAGRGIRIEKLNANSPQEVVDALRRPFTQQNLLVHFHDCPPALFTELASPHLCTAYAFRDPRDIAVSQMNLHDVDLEQAVTMTVAACRNFVALLPRSRHVLFVPYVSIAEQPEAVVRQLALHMGFVVGSNEVEMVCRETSPDKHRAVMEHVAASDAAATIDTGLREVRFDPDTLINDRHVQSGKTGRWRTELPADRAEWLDGVLRPFIEEVFEPPSLAP